MREGANSPAQFLFVRDALCCYVAAERVAKYGGMWMPYPGEFVKQNMASRERLEKIANLDDAAYKRAVSDEWTVGMALAHIAFWDRRALFVIERWEKEGPGPSALDSDSINAALDGFLAVIPPQASGELALQAAEQLDAKLEKLSDPLADYLFKEEPFAPVRATHRNEHLDQIEQALGK